MDEPTNNVTHALPFFRHTLAEVKTACANNTLGSLKWHENTNGKPNAFARIYVRMPNDAVDLVVQTDDPHAPNARFEVFPAAQWAPKDPTQDTVHAITSASNHALKELVADTHLVNRYGPLYDDESPTVVQMGQQLQARQEHTRRHDQELATLQQYDLDIARAIERIGHVVPNANDAAAIHDYMTALQRSHELVRDYLPRLQELREHNLAMVGQLEHGLELYKKGDKPQALDLKQQVETAEMQTGSALRNHGRSFDGQFNLAIERIHDATKDLEDSVDGQDLLSEAVRGSIKHPYYYWNHPQRYRSAGTEGRPFGPSDLKEHLEKLANSCRTPIHEELRSGRETLAATLDAVESLSIVLNKVERPDPIVSSTSITREKQSILIPSGNEVAHQR